MSLGKGDTNEATPFSFFFFNSICSTYSNFFYICSRYCNCTLLVDIVFAVYIIFVGLEGICNNFAKVIQNVHAFKSLIVYDELI